MRIVHSISGLRKNAGTTTFLIEALQYTSKEKGVEIFLLAKKNQLETTPNFRINRITPTNTFAYHTLLKSIHKEKPIDIVNIHGIWSPSDWVTFYSAKKLRIPVIWSTHGMLAKDALRFSYWKKKIVFFLFLKGLLKKTEAFHATSELEANIIKGSGYTQPILIGPPGISQKLVNEKTEFSKPKTLLFLSRIHPIKNLSSLIKAWGQVDTKDWQLLIVGPDEEEEASRIAETIREKNLHNILIRGPAYEEEKQNILRQASAFVLPSFTENFGIVVIEALAKGLPVITTTGCPWEELESHGCGWWVKADPDNLSLALSTLFNLSDSELKEYSDKAVGLVRKNYLWPKISENMLSFYRELLRNRSSQK
ncbi:MAG: glycosyltransferase [Opitutales bacterium]|nr:glycosyltransferase [Opitutales bacterium]